MSKNIYGSILQVLFIFPNITICGKYDFALFEGFEETRKIFENEMKIIFFLGTFSNNLIYSLRYLDQVMKADKTSHVSSSRHHVSSFSKLLGYDQFNLYKKPHFGRGLIEMHIMRHLKNNIMDFDINIRYRPMSY